MGLRMLLIFLLVWSVGTSALRREDYDYALEDYVTHAQTSTNTSSPAQSLSDDLGEEAWSEWSDWADCSRSCDGGVTYQVRRCNALAGCSGEKIRYQICNMQPCDTPIDFRAEQCAQFNGQLYNGLRATWAPHIEAENPCALTCITQNGDIVTLNSRVQDGTRCTGVSLDMCINGMCQKVGCDLRIGSDLTVDSCGVCGGDDSACRDQAAEYYYWTAVQSSECSRSCGGGVSRPKVQCRSRVTEEVVKDDLCKVEQRPRVQETECNTHPCATRWVAEPWGHCSMQCGKGIRSRKYHCSQDIDGVPTRIPHHHCSKHHKPKTQEPCFIQPCAPKWITQKWSPCSVQCGEGIQTRNVTCNEGRADIECAHLEKPADVRTCSSEIQCDWNQRTLELEYRFRNISTAEKLVGKLSPSEPAWSADDWSDCSAPCGTGVRRRRVVCKIFLEFSKTFATLPDTECEGPKPVIEEKCLLGPCVVKNRWATEPWSNCSVPCGDGLKTRSVLCKTYLENARLLVTVPDDQCKEPKPVARQRCMMPLCALEHKLEAAAFQDEEVKVVSGSKGSFTYSWRSEDYTQCSQSCLQGIQENIVMCIRDQDTRSVHPGLCDPKTRPEVITRTCNDFSCPPRWQTGEFQPCSKTCGLGIQLREVVCVHEVVRNSTSVVPNIQCPQPPPPDRQYCAVIDCPILWHTDKWSKCSRPCGGGVKTRKVECKQEMAQRHIVNRLPTQCPKHRPVDKRPCNTKPCASEAVRPFIAIENSTFIQENPDQVKVHLKVGVHATVYYNTQLKIKCPVHQFDRSKIKWSKDGQVIRRGKNYKISKKGALKVVRATFQDNGVFTCRAGQSQAEVTLVVKPKSGVFINSEELPHGDGSKADPPSPEVPPPRSRDFPNSAEPGKSRLRFDPEDSHEKNPTGGAGSTRSPYPETRRRKPSLTSRPSRRPPTEDRDLTHENQTQNTSDGGAAKSGASRLVPNFHSLLSHLQTLWPFQSYDSVRSHQSRLTDEESEVWREETPGRSQDSVGGAESGVVRQDDTIENGQSGQKLDEDASSNGGEDNENRAETDRISSKSDHRNSFEQNLDPMSENTDLSNSEDGIKDGQNVFRTPKITPGFRSGDSSRESESFTKGVGSRDDRIRSSHDKRAELSGGAEDSQNGGDAHAEDAPLSAGVFPFALAQIDGRYDEEEMGEEFVLGKGSRENLKFEWVLTDWSKCSQPCGGNGFRMRAAHCMAVVHNRSRSVDAALCTDAALSTPATIEPCGAHYCPVWKTGLWNSCDESQCFTWNTAIQTRTIWCEAENGTHLNDSYCEHDITPLTRQECYNDLCKGVWRTGEWSECTARCEGDGIKYRILQCVWYGTRRPAGNACRDQTRPSVMRTCRGGPCSVTNSKCEDTSKYCRNVRKFNLCKQEQYRVQCCKSCRR